MRPARAAQRPHAMAGPCRMQSRGSPAARPRPATTTARAAANGFLGKRLVFSI